MFWCRNSDVFHSEVLLLEPLRVSRIGQDRHHILENSALRNTAGTKSFRRGILDAYHHFTHGASPGEGTLLVRKPRKLTWN